MNSMKWKSGLSEAKIIILDDVGIYKEREAGRDDSEDKVANKVVSEKWHSQYPELISFPALIAILIIFIPNFHQ
jgi:hypothetical protein